MVLMTGWWLVIPAVLLAGALIGATGIGGVLLVPVLTRLADVAPPAAIAASSVAFALPALVALRPLRREPDLVRRCVPLLVASLAGAVAGAMLVQWLAPRVLLAGVTLLVLFAGWRGLQAPGPATTAPVRLTSGRLAAIGVAVGLGSALTGTGGPVLLLPVLLLLRQPVTFAVVAAQAIQLPVAVASGTVHVLAGRLDWSLSAVCGILLLVGSVVGQRAAEGLPALRLRQGVACLLLAVGLWFGWLLLA